MSRPRYDWWGYMLNIIRRYPERKKQLEELRQTPVTPKYAVERYGNGSCNPVEVAATKNLGEQEMREFEAVSAAIRETAKMATGEARLAIIDLLYWKRYWKTIDGAAYEVGYSKDRVKDFHGEFVRLVGYYMGYLPREKVRRKRNVTPNSQKTVSK